MRVKFYAKAQLIKACDLDPLTSEAMIYTMLKTLAEQFNTTDVFATVYVRKSIRLRPSDVSVIKDQAQSLA